LSPRKVKKRPVTPPAWKKAVLPGWGAACLGTPSFMAAQDNQGGGMSVREAGRRGGERVKAKYGSEFYEEIGRKGGQATKTKYGPAFYEVIGQKGGQKLKRRTPA
jgi:general stress protein YciG